MKNSALITSGKLLSRVSQTLNLGNGSTWPGHLALKANPLFIQELLHRSATKVIFIVGTNGKTTTSSLLNHILRTHNVTVVHNNSGANLLNGIASTLLLAAHPSGKLTADVALFEVDENAFPKACEVITPDMVIMLNLFRDQLDRYGEVNTIALRWQETLAKLPETTSLLLNADDPQIAFLGEKAKQHVDYFGGTIDKQASNVPEHAADSLYCPNCGEKLNYQTITYSHLGIWNCPACKLKTPQSALRRADLYPLQGSYNAYNTHAAVLAAQKLAIPSDVISRALQSFKPAFGRQETINYQGKNVEVILAKNPTGFNEALRTIQTLKAKTILLVLNDNIADGTDVSWIWDIDVSLLKPFVDKKIYLSGTRVYDLGLRLKYEGLTMDQVYLSPDLETTIAQATRKASDNETLYMLPTYTAMLETRKILTGKKIL
jgi:UDP-N-acetylmuramyl tripeptide synthase